MSAVSDRFVWVGVVIGFHQLWASVWLSVWPWLICLVCFGNPCFGEIDMHGNVKWEYGAKGMCVCVSMRLWLCLLVVLCDCIWMFVGAVCGQQCESLYVIICRVLILLVSIMTTRNCRWPSGDTWDAPFQQTRVLAKASHTFSEHGNKQSTDSGIVFMLHSCASGYDMVYASYIATYKALWFVEGQIARTQQALAKHAVKSQGPKGPKETNTWLAWFGDARREGGNDAQFPNERNDHFNGKYIRRWIYFFEMIGRGHARLKHLQNEHFEMKIYSSIDMRWDEMRWCHDNMMQWW